MLKSESKSGILLKKVVKIVGYSTVLLVVPGASLIYAIAYLRNRSKGK